MSIELKVKKLNDKAVIPSYAYEGDACFDLVATSRELSPQNGTVIYGFGLAFEIPKGYVGEIYPRSSIGTRTDFILSNSIGIIDSSYRGEIKAIFRLARPTGRIYEVGERIAQMRITKVEPVKIIESNELSNTERGNGGFGSSGK